jgi:hypothetical protein
MSIIRPSQLFKICTFCLFICISNSVSCSADQQSVPPAKAIESKGDLTFTPKPLTLKGYLRRPDGAGRYPAIAIRLVICPVPTKRRARSFSQVAVANADPDISPEHLVCWRSVTSGPFKSMLFDGEHFFLNSARTCFLQAMRLELAMLGLE